MHFRLTQNFFDPLTTSDGKNFAKARFKEIISEQVALSYLTKGGVSYGDSENMSPNERHIALESIKEILEQQAEAQKKAMQEAQANR